MTPAWIAFGANLGDPERTLARAEALLSARGVVLRRRSRLYASRPEGGAAEPDYANAVLEAESDLDARALLGALQAVEQELGRPRAHAPGPRTCDLDLLALGDTVLDEGPSLVVPHPRLQGRAFVLVPLVELDPQWRHPRLGTTAGEMLAALAAAPGDVRRYEAVPAGIPRG